jgi:transposase
VTYATTFIGIDAHKKDLVIATLGAQGSAVSTLTVPHEPRAVRRLVRQLEREHDGPIVACYEAGPCGYALQRQLATARITCQVIAPALIPRKPGDRIKTNRRDARKLAELLRAGVLTAVHPPTPADEAVRDLCRAREDAREDLQRARHRLDKLLLRRGLHYVGRQWTPAHRRWIASLEWVEPAEQLVMADYLLGLEQQEGRLTELNRHLTALAAQEPYRIPVSWLRCFRGIDTIGAMLILGELHDWRRFPDPRGLMAYLGLVPSESSTGDKHHRGRITRMGNTVVRRVLVEIAWHYQHRPGVGPALRKRRAGQPPDVIAIAEKAQQRLCRRFRRLVARHMPPPKAAVAIARELVGFLWAVMQQPSSTRVV